MQCPRCHAGNREGRRFCAECAAPLASSCPACGFANEPGEKFCGGCAAALTVASRPLEPRFGSLQAYTPEHLAAKILTSRSALEGERKQVTVLFADLKGSLELLADRDPEEARALLDPVLTRLMESVHRYEGTVNQVMGDGIMALFGAPLAHEDHAVRACYAALDMQAALRPYAEEVWRAHGLRPQIRVGLNSGEVVVRTIGSDLRMDYSAVGQTTHLAGRMEQLATPGTVLLTAETLRLAEGYVAVTPLGPIPVKGLEAPLEVYELTGAGPRRSRLHAAAARGLTRFVGREGELEQLHQALGRAADGQGQVVAIVGEPGVGKSRLVWEVVHSHRVHGWLALQAGSVSYGQATAYLPIVELLKSYFAIEDRDGPRAVREKVTGKLLTLDRALEGSLPALLSLLDVPPDDPQWPALDPLQRRRRTLDAVKRLLLRETQGQPLLAVFEDLHWFDAETQALLDGLVESLPAARLLLLVNYRPEYQHPWGSRTYYTQLRLDPLPQDHADALLGALLGADATLEPLRRALIARTEGNPFFLEESVRALAETGALAGGPGAYRLGRPLSAIQVPATVQAVLAARIDRLPPEDKALLQTASVVGKDVPFALLQAIADSPEDELRAAIGRLQAGEFLYEARLFPDLEYTFKHALTHDVTYGSLLQDRRRRLHAEIVEALERLYPGRTAEHSEQLAHHAVRGEAWAKAVPYLRQAGAKAAARSAHREAVGYFEQALAALTHFPETRESQELAIDLRFDLRNSLFPLAELGRMERYLREAEAPARALDDQRRLGWVSTYMGSYHLVTGRHVTEVRKFAERVGAIAEALDDRPFRIVSGYYLVMAHHIAGDYRETERVCRALIVSLQDDPAHERFGLAQYPAELARSYLARALAERGELDEAQIHGQDAIRIAEALDYPFTLVFACLGLGYVHSVRGDLSQAARLLERALALCHDWDFPFLTPIAAAFLGHVYAWSGRVAEGISWLGKATDAYESAGIGYFHSIGVVQLGEAYLFADRLEDARAGAERAVGLARQRGERGYEAWALRLLGEIASHPKHLDPASAEAHYGAALALADELGMRPLAAHCRLGLGTLYRRAGDRARAEAHLVTATTLYREMGMDFWLARAEAMPASLGPDARGAQTGS